MPWGCLKLCNNFYHLPLVRGNGYGAGDGEMGAIADLGGVCCGCCLQIWRHLSSTCATGTCGAGIGSTGIEEKLGKIQNVQEITKKGEQNLKISGMEIGKIEKTFFLNENIWGKIYKNIPTQEN